MADGLEAIDVIDAFGLNFELGNVIKYVLRAGKKSKETYASDLMKAREYLDHEITRYAKEEISCPEQ